MHYKIKRNSKEKMKAMYTNKVISVAIAFEHAPNKNASTLPNDVLPCNNTILIWSNTVLLIAGVAEV